jgi:hypothetical protein
MASLKAGTNHRSEKYQTHENPYQGDARQPTFVLGPSGKPVTKHTLAIGLLFFVWTFGILIGYYSFLWNDAPYRGRVANLAINALLPRISDYSNPYLQRLRPALVLLAQLFIIRKCVLILFKINSTKRPTWSPWMSFFITQVATAITMADFKGYWFAKDSVVQLQNVLIFRFTMWPWFYFIYLLAMDEVKSWKNPQHLLRMYTPYMVFVYSLNEFTLKA